MYLPLLSDTVPIHALKTLLQGERQIVCRKGKTPGVTVYNSGVYITANVLPVIPGPDGDAIYLRLEAFETKALPVIKKDSKVKFRNHCMEVRNC